ncbi:MAG: ribbon-helix-helix protein, CopG family [Nitrospirae bacterium]|nr:ribbon-helix-helix protein, CopG family [Nitrospirota bacterium]MBF0540782.1 ribbon-helix-helix protein, CopG family [Nitrospirota bacterium]
MSVSVLIDNELKDRIESLSSETGKPSSYHIEQAIRQYLEDREDYLKGLAILQRKEPSISLDELKKYLELGD